MPASPNDNRRMQLAGQGGAASERGYAMAALLVGLSVMAVLMTAALPQWAHLARREKEIELIWRGQQYARAIDLFQRRYANAYPPSLDVLVEQRFLRRKYLDPITGEEFQPIYFGQPLPGAPQGPGAGPPGRAQQVPAAGGSSGTPGGTLGGTRDRIGPQAAGPTQGPVVGVVSRSAETSIRLWNGRNKYNEWVFVHVPAATQPAAPGQGGRPGEPRGGQPGAGPPRPGAGPPTTVRPPVALPPLQPPGRPPGSGGR